MPNLCCEAPGCARAAKNRRLCWAHYKRMRKYGTFNLPTVMDRIMDAVTVDSNTACWVWSRGLESNGYARMSVNGKVQSVHRITYWERHGYDSIPAGWHIDHLCRNRACCNPDHLEAVTPWVNVMRSPFTQASINASKTECFRGHPLSGDNLSISERGHRTCRTCSRIKTAQYRARLEEKSVA